MSLLKNKVIVKPEKKFSELMRQWNIYMKDCLSTINQTIDMIRTKNLFNHINHTDFIFLLLLYTVCTRTHRCFTRLKHALKIFTLLSFF